MAWAIDLDDGTLINSLGAGLNRNKSIELPEMHGFPPCFGSTWPSNEDMARVESLER